MNKEEMVNEIHSYVKHLVFAKNCLDAYMSLVSVSHNNIDFLSKAPGFFTITQYALSKCLFVEFAKLYCGSGKEKTIIRLLNIVDANINVFTNGNVKDISICYRTKYNITISPILEKLKVRRDKDLVHNDPDFFYGDINPAVCNYISQEECTTLFNYGFQLCLSLLDCLPAPHSVQLYYGADDLIELAKDYTNKE